MEVFKLIRPEKNEVPVIISSPHSGTEFPDELKASYIPERITDPDDTDWFIDQLYSFATDMGITMISAVFNRWVIDLNRDPADKPLYSDGRIITGLVPSTTFNGEPLYKGSVPDDEEIDRRIQKYYLPYHNALRELVNEKLEKFGRVVLFDAHSIRKHVPGIRETPFPDLILGDNDGKTASPGVIEAAWRALDHPGFSRSHNHPFKGGYITRHFGQPDKHIHALQLEMAKTNYMDDTETEFSEQRAEKLLPLLKNLFSNLIKVLS